MTPSPTPVPAGFARLLADAHSKARSLPVLSADDLPQDTDEAYQIQHRTLALLGQPVAGWKIGARAPDGPIQGAPLPGQGVHSAPASLARAGFPVLGLELEIAFRLGRTFAPQGRPYSGDEILGSVAEVMAAIEIVSSRLPGWPQVPRLAQLADLQNHGALITGPAQPWHAGDFSPTSVPLSFRLDDEDLAPGPGDNPAGDLGRLLVWLVHHANGLGLAVGPEQVLTTGSYTGMAFPERGGLVTGELAGLPPVILTLI